MSKHTAVVHDGHMYMYGGIYYNNSVSDFLGAQIAHFLRDSLGVVVVCRLGWQDLYVTMCLPVPFSRTNQSTRRKVSRLCSPMRRFVTKI